MEAVAKLNNCPTSPRKMRLVVDLIRGERVEKALYILKYTNKEAAIRVEKLLLSAIKNWEAKNEGQRPEDSELFVKTIMVDGGRQLKRLRPAPQGRGHRIRKRSNHVTLMVDSKNSESNTQEGEMGQKAHPIGNRLGIIKGWDSNWFGGNDYSDKLVEDEKIRKYLSARIPKGGISKVVIERTLKRITITIHTARPGIVIGKGGQE